MYRLLNKRLPSTTYFSTGTQYGENSMIILSKHFDEINNKAEYLKNMKKELENKHNITITGINLAKYDDGDITDVYKGVEQVTQNMCVIGCHTHTQHAEKLWPIRFIPNKDMMLEPIAINALLTTYNMFEIIAGNGLNNEKLNLKDKMIKLYGQRFYELKHHYGTPMGLFIQEWSEKCEFKINQTLDLYENNVIKYNRECYDSDCKVVGYLHHAMENRVLSLLKLLDEIPYNRLKELERYNEKSDKLMEDLIKMGDLPKKDEN